LGFLAVILAGAVALTSPACSKGEPLAFVDAVFTSASAVCVTGLTVKDTGGDFTFLGQVIILLLIQAGALGIMTLSSGLLQTMGARAPLGDRVAYADDMSDIHAPDYNRTFRFILTVTLGLEAAGAVLMAPVMVARDGWRLGLWSSLFHSVSAFCNAGFSLYEDSLCGFRANVWINLVICALILCGGIGFVVLWDVGQWLRRRRLGRGQRWRLSLHSRMVLLTSALLVVAGAVVILLLEWRVSLAECSWGEMALASLFQSITARTAGFNTTPIYAMSNATLLVLILLMFVGASPFSTGGGVKTTTLATLAVVAFSRLRGHEEANCMGRRLTERSISRAVTAVLFAGAALSLFLVALLVSEHGGMSHGASRGRFLEILFEAVSAFGTVGLSVGVTPSLSVAGKIVVSLLMYIGRVRPLALMASLSLRERRDAVRFPSEDVMIG